MLYNAASALEAARWFSSETIWFQGQESHVDSHWFQRKQVFNRKIQFRFTWLMIIVFALRFVIYECEAPEAGNTGRGSNKSLDWNSDP